jgi:hypothetical protein
MSANGLGTESVGNGLALARVLGTITGVEQATANRYKGDRAEHSRKRKTVSHTFSAKSIGQFEQYIHGNIEAWEVVSFGAGFRGLRH